MSPSTARDGASSGTALREADAIAPERITETALESRGSKWPDVSFRWVLFAALAVSMATLAVLLIFILVAGWPRFNLQLLTNMPSIRLPDLAGAQSAIMGSIWVIATTAVIALPVGIMAAIYLEEYGDPTSRFYRIVEVNIQNLAAVPSIVYGILGLGIFVRAMALGQSVIAAALTLALLVLPVIIIATREAIRAVPQSIRFGSMALGATKWQTIWKQVLPAALPGTATGAILSMSRAIGEAAPLLLLGAVTFITFNPSGLMSDFTVMPIQIYNWVSQSRDEFHILAAALCIVLLIILMIMNGAAIFLRNKYQKRW